MKNYYKPLSALLTLSLIFILYACPIGLEYSLGIPGSEKIDTKLIGTWKVNGETDAEVIELTIAKRDNMSYNVTVLEAGEMYSLTTKKLTGWVTKVDGETFLYVKPEDEEKYYHYHYSFDDKNTMRIFDVSLLDGGVDAITSTESMRTQVANSIGKEGWGTEQLTYARQ